MQAAVCHQFNTPLTIESVQLAPPGVGEIKVELAACAICHSDIHYWQGAWGGPLPAIYGHEAAGIVREIGPDVVGLAPDGLAPGDPVVVTLIRACGRCAFCAAGQPTLCTAIFPLDQHSPLRLTDGTAVFQAMRSGAFAEQIIVHHSQAVKIPASMPLPQASLLACGVLTGVGAVTNTAQMKAGQSAVVIGCGGVGLNTVQGARLAGADPIIAIDLADNKLQTAVRFGATHTLNPTREDARAAVQTLINGQGADVVFVTVGSAAALAQGMELLHRAGTLVVVGMPPSGVKLPVEMADFAGSGQRILGSKMGLARPQIDIPHLVTLYQQGDLLLDELISGRFPLDQINQAIDAVVTGKALRNVIIFP